MIESRPVDCGSGEPLEWGPGVVSKWAAGGRLLACFFIWATCMCWVWPESIWLGLSQHASACMVWLFTDGTAGAKPRRKLYHDSMVGEGWAWFVQKEQREPQVSQ